MTMTPPSDISSEAWKLIQTAKALALRERATALLPHHLFQACVIEQRDLVIQTLQDSQPVAKNIASLLDAVVSNGWGGSRDDTSATIATSLEARQLIQAARDLARRETPGGNPRVEPVHVWVSVCASAATLKGWLRTRSWPDALIDQLAHAPQKRLSPRAASALKDSEAAVLDRFCSRNLTRLAERGELDIAHGMAHVRQQIVNILLKKNKRSVVLTGPAGVGKTKLAEDLSVAIVRGEVPALAGCNVYELDLVQFTRGTHLVGSQQERFAQLTEVLSAHPEHVILFIDELHMIVGVSMGGESMNLANALKPLLTHDKLRIIGATTSNEYRRYIEGDPALARRFTEVKISEPDRESTLAILRSAAPTYEAHHGVCYSEESLREMYDMASLYFPNLAFPAKGVDLMDEVGVQVRVRHASTHDIGQRPIVHPPDVRETFKRVWGIEPQSITVDLAALIKERVSGQDHAAEQLADLVAVSRFRRESELRGQPRLSILLVGPPGVGKSYMARALSETLFPGRDTLLTLDMTEFAGPHAGEHTRFRLLGPPAPYVGWETGGLLTSHALQYPYSVVLVDELDKAPNEARNIFLRILNDGAIQDGRGRIVSFRGMYFIFTANAGRDLWESGRKPELGFRAEQRTLAERPPQGSNNPSDAAIREALRRENFAPEFLSRLSHVVLFRQLTDGDLTTLSISELQRLADEVLTTDSILLAYDEASLGQWLVERTPAPRDCRLVKAAFEAHVETPLARWRLQRSDRDAVILRLEPHGERVTVTPEREQAQVDAMLLSRVHDVFNRQTARLRNQRAAQALLGPGA